jgi:hypothetical protein
MDGFAPTIAPLLVRLFDAGGESPMVKQRERVTIDLDPESELAKALAEAGRKPVGLISNGRRYVVNRDPDDLWDDDDADEFQRGLNAVVGTLSPEQGEQFKELIYRGREEGTRPINRP